MKKVEYILNKSKKNEFDFKNTAYRKNGTRQCRKCRNISVAKCERNNRMRANG